jgi:peptidoglycan/LPS O-acetylase OafA/YrhL
MSPAPLCAQPAASHLERIDLLRAVAILLVVISHALPYVTPGEIDFSLMGIAGVALFFVVSGFCIHLSAVRTLDRSDGAVHFLGQFFWRRFWRIYPAYLVALLVFWKLVGRGELPASQLWSHLILIQNWRREWFFSINGCFWSLAVEWQFYLAYPLLLFLRRRFGLNAMFVAVAAFCAIIRVVTCCLWQDWTGPLNPVLWCSPLLLLFDWTLGVWLADVWMSGKIPKHLESVGVAALALIAVADRFPYARPHCFTLFSIAGIGVMAYALRRQAPLSRVARATIPLGLCSYSLYLWHQPLIGRILYYAKLMHLAPIPSNPVLSLCLICLPAIGLWSWLSLKLIENPGIALGRIFSVSRARAATA